MNGLLTDLYQLTMAAGYFRAGKVQERATFELYVRRLPRNRNYVVAAGLQQASSTCLTFASPPKRSTTFAACRSSPAPSPGSSTR